MKKLKILMVAGSMHVGGIENQLMHLARNADKNKFQIDFTSTMKNAFYRDEIESLGGKFILIPDTNWRKPWEYCIAMYKIMKNESYDVVHSHELFHSGITLSIAKLAGVKSRIAHAHNWCDDDGTGKKRSLIRQIYNSIMRKLILCFSTSQLACSTWAGRFLYGEKCLTKSSYHLIYNSVDTSKFLLNYDKKESGEFCENDKWINVINVARISAVKNQEFLVKIASEFKKRKSNIRILCAGSGDDDAVEQIVKMIKAEELNDYIQLLGVRNDIDVLMRKAKAFVLPSKYEGMPLVLIEAQSAGLPCIVADTFSREVDFGLGRVNWLKLEEGSSVWADALEEAVKKVTTPKRDVEKIIIDKQFDAAMFAEKLCELYQTDYKNQRK